MRASREPAASVSVLKPLGGMEPAVESNYLEQVTAPLADSRVGIDTCLYRARSIGSYWSRVGVLFIDEWFAPSVRIAHAAFIVPTGVGVQEATVVLLAQLFCDKPIAHRLVAAPGDPERLFEVFAARNASVVTSGVSLRNGALYIAVSAGALAAHAV